MKSARNTLPSEPVNGLTCGIDWAREDHALSIVDAKGRETTRKTISHDAAGLRDLIATLDQAGVCEVAIERPDGPVVAALLEAGTTVVVISPNQVKNLRGRYGSAGNKDDRFDAFVLADTLRTDRARLHPLLPDSPATVALRQTCRARKDLVAHRVAVANQLRAHLMIVFPGVVGLFAQIDSPISLAFLTRFDCQERADWLSITRWANWLASVGYSGRTHPRELHRRLTSATRGATGLSGTTITAAYVATLTTLNNQIKTLDDSIAEQLNTHADAHIFTSLPRSGTSCGVPLRGSWPARRDTGAANCASRAEGLREVLKVAALSGPGHPRTGGQPAHRGLNGPHPPARATIPSAARPE